MKSLVIVESPSKAKTIEKYLGKNYKVVSSKGHIRDLAIKGKDGLGVDIENNFEPSYVISKDKRDLVKDLKKQAEKYDQVLLATDMDREGEAISWHLAKVLELDEKAIDRIVFNEITKDAILKAVDNPRSIDMDLVHSQEARRILDRIIGFKLSKLLQKKIKSKSAGRVQSVALKMICDREKEIKAFVPEEYWKVAALFNKDNIEFKADLVEVDAQKAKLSNKEEADAILARLDKHFEISKINSSKKKRNPYLPFTTSTLQQEASTKLRFGARKTMMIAQMLYEGIDIGSETRGLITYMRTDSTRLSNDFVSDAKRMIETEYGKEYVGVYRVKKDDNAQDAHEAIRPTDLKLKPEDARPYLSDDQYKLYKFIYNRCLASLMAASINNTLVVSFEHDNIIFNASGSVQVFDGFLKVYKEYDNSKDVVLPELKEKENLIAENIEASQHFSEPPQRYSEARLIKALEEEGIGRPSTYATILDTIIKRNYVELKKASDGSKTKVFFPTEQGTLTYEKLGEFFKDIINEKYTASMEKELDLIAENKLEVTKSLRDFYNKFEPLYEKANEEMPKIEAEKTGESCPQCGGDLVIRNGRFGKFVSCSNFPKCRYTANLENKNEKKKEEAQPTGITCPDCGGELLKRKSRYGKYFLGCSNFPKCHHIENINEEGKDGK